MFSFLLSETRFTLSRHGDSHESVSLPDRSNVGESSCSTSRFTRLEVQEACQTRCWIMESVNQSNGPSHAHNTTMTDARSRV
jgi:hypothetical protein